MVPHYLCGLCHMVSWICTMDPVSGDRSLAGHHGWSTAQICRFCLYGRTTWASYQWWCISRECGLIINTLPHRIQMVYICMAMASHFSQYRDLVSRPGHEGSVLKPGTTVSDRWISWYQTRAQALPEYRIQCRHGYLPHMTNDFRVVRVVGVAIAPITPNIVYNKHEGCSAPCAGHNREEARENLPWIALW